MKHTGRALKWIIPNSMAVYVLYMAGKGTTGFENVLKFIVWVMFGVTLLIFLASQSAEFKRKAREQNLLKPPVPLSLMAGYDLFYAIALSYTGYLFLAFVYMITSMLQWALYWPQNKENRENGEGNGRNY
jgi:hypothetical protein